MLSGGMKTGRPLQIPPASALMAFDSAARHASFTLAARELGTSQAAVSRQIAKLETWLSVRLFERSRAGATLTDAGKRFHNGVAAGLAAIHEAAAEATELSRTEEVVISCSHDASHCFIMPHYHTLRRLLGRDVRIRILTYHPSVHRLSFDPSVDILLTWNAADVDSEDEAVVIREAIRPVCSPIYATIHAQVLAGSVAGWSGLTLLDLTGPNEGWATWEDWFAVAGSPDGTPARAEFDCYTYVLEAAAAGHGIALGWRHQIRRSIKSGSLVQLGDGFVETENRFFGVLTEKGRRKPLARTCLALLNRPE